MTTLYKSSQTLIKAVQEFEGLRLKVYRCSAGVLTVGYGHTGSDVKEGMVITKEKAMELLKRDLANFECFVNKLGVCKTQGQFDSLVDFSFNLGTAALASSTLLKYIKLGLSNDAIQKQFKKWIYCNKKVLPGLVKRRDWEAKRWAE